MPQVNLQTPVRFLKGVGPEKSKILARLGLETVEDLFYFFPRRYEDRFPVKPLSEITRQDKECVTGSVTSRGMIRTSRGQSIFKVVISDGEGALFGVWFNQPYLAKVFLPKTQVVFYGRVETSGKHLQIVHPEYEILKNGGLKDSVHMGRITPVYALTEELSQKSLRLLVFQAVERMAWLLKDPLSFSFRKKVGLADRVFAFKQIHFPSTHEDQRAAYRRLVFDEFLILQLIIQLKRIKLQAENRSLLHSRGEKDVAYFLETLGFELTTAQKTALQDVLNDMKTPKPMNRLIQGDVGSGKTVVAAAALLFTAQNGFQGVLMAPTEVLAQQHYFTLTQLLEPFGIRCGYLAQGLSEGSRKELLSGLSEGRISVVVGTHALIQENVKFSRLGLVVVDEQHKFGVLQRSALKEKSAEPAHFLLMTATPIPRTLAMTLYGELDISTIRERPQGRKPIKTFWVGEGKREEIYGLLDLEIAKGRQAYVICPLIEECGDFSAKSVLSVHRSLSRLFSHRKIDILHGRMNAGEKHRVMKEFREGSIEVLISTVVIEVGIDVPNATVLVIENAEKFGLAQLHQLRGRVGRGQEDSLCILFSDTSNPESAERLRAFEESDSGFDIAEKDLNLRGAGDLIGERQHGLPLLRIGDFAKDAEILEWAQREAREIIREDPALRKSRNQSLRREIQKRTALSEEQPTVTA